MSWSSTAQPKTATSHPLTQVTPYHVNCQSQKRNSPLLTSNPEATSIRSNRKNPTSRERTQLPQRKIRTSNSSRRRPLASKTHRCEVFNSIGGREIRRTRSKMGPRDRGSWEERIREKYMKAGIHMDLILKEDRNKEERIAEKKVRKEEN